MDGRQFMKESIKNTSFTTKDLIQGHPERKILQIICNDFNVDFFKKGNEKYITVPLKYFGDGEEKMRTLFMTAHFEGSIHFSRDDKHKRSETKIFIPVDEDGREMEFVIHFIINDDGTIDLIVSLRDINGNDGSGFVATKHCKNIPVSVDGFRMAIDVIRDNLLDKYNSVVCIGE